MNQRERFLVILVGGLVGVIGIQWLFNKYRSAISTRSNRLASLVSSYESDQQVWLAGAEAEMQMGEYLSRSLPSNSDTAKSNYQAWLLETAISQGLENPTVIPTSNLPIGDLYHRFSFRVTGETDMPGAVDLLTAIHNYDTLHRVRTFSLIPDADFIRLDMTIDAASLNIADETAEIPGGNSWRIAGREESLRNTILNRNFFEPPNQSPRYSGPRVLVATRGKSNNFDLRFKDPENTRLAHELIAELPDWASWDAQSARLSLRPPLSPPPEDQDSKESAAPAVEGEGNEESEDVKSGDDTNPPSASDKEGTSEDDSQTDSDTPDTESENSEPVKDEDSKSKAPSFREQLELLIRASDEGYQKRQAEETLVVRFRDPDPVVEETPEIKPKFDDARQTFLSGIITGRNGWQAWLSVRTRGKNLKLRVGDSFVIGTVEGKITEINAKQVTFDVDGNSYVIKPSDKLSDVVAKD